MRWLVLIGAIQASAAQACGVPARDASRIAVAGGSITEVLYFLGEQHRIVAVDTTSNYPPQALELPSVGYVRNLPRKACSLSIQPSSWVRTTWGRRRFSRRSSKPVSKQFD